MKALRYVTLSSAEAELVSLSEAVIMFTIQLLRSIKISIEHPVMVRFDNVGSLFMSNITSTFCISHMDVKCKYVTEYMEHGIVKIIFVKSAKNESCTHKDLSGELHHQHSRKMIGEKPK